MITIADAFIDEMTKQQSQSGQLSTDTIQETAKKLLKIRQSDFDPSLVVALLELLSLEVPNELAQFRGNFIK